MIPGHLVVEIDGVDHVDVIRLAVHLHHGSVQHRERKRAPSAFVLSRGQVLSIERTRAVVSPDILEDIVPDNLSTRSGWKLLISGMESPTTLLGLTTHVPWAGPAVARIEGPRVRGLADGAFDQVVGEKALDATAAQEGARGRASAARSPSSHKKTREPTSETSPSFWTRRAPP